MVDNGGMPLAVGTTVFFAGADAVVRDVGIRAGGTAYLVESGPMQLPMWVPAGQLEDQPAQSTPAFSQHSPDLLVVDDFFRDPDSIRALALAQEYGSDLRYYKGLRTHDRFLWPHLREEFGRLLGKEITEWLGYPANGIFQQTSNDDPLVWHHDTQQYAAAVYLNPGGAAGGGTTFWRDKTYGCRHAPRHRAEASRLGGEEAIASAESVVYDTYNVSHPDNWELVESVAGLYNRLVIWDAKLIHSATSYSEFAGDAPSSTRLVQLFFFDAD